MDDDHKPFILPEGSIFNTSGIKYTGINSTGVDITLWNPDPPIVKRVINCSCGTNTTMGPNTSHEFHSSYCELSKGGK